MSERLLIDLRTKTEIANNRILAIRRFEADGDEALKRGNFASALASFNSGIKLAYVSCPDLYHHIAMKVIAMPLFAHTYYGPHLDNGDPGSRAYVGAGVLMQDDLSYMQHAIPLIQDPEPRREARWRCFGRLSESTIFALGARWSEEDGSYIPLSTSQKEDKAGIDLHLWPTDDSSELIRVQIKTSLKQRITPTDDPTLRVIYMEQIDPKYFLRPHHEESIASCMLRELDGTPHKGDDEKLAEATTTFLSIVHSKQRELVT